MSDLARPGGYLQSLGAHVHDAVTVVAGTPDAIQALRGLVLTVLRRPIAGINEVYTELDSFDRTEERYIEIGRTTAREEWHTEIDRCLGLAFSSMQRPTTPPALAPTTALALSLATGIELWLQEDERSGGGLLLAFTVATPETADSDAVRLAFNQRRAALTFRPGSLEALLIWDGFVRAGRWVVSLVRGNLGRVRSADAAARAFVSNLRTARENQKAEPLPLIRLDEGSSALPTAKETGVVVFLHGLMSTDLGTFDGFMRRWLDPNPFDVVSWLDKRSSKVPSAEEQFWLSSSDRLPERARDAIKGAVAFVGWPHDTLTSIDQNAHSLARLIDERMGKGECKVAFLCHSRGGLVARAAAEKLYAKSKVWEQRICRCITFGTPHEGVALAEHPDRRLGAYVLSGLSRKELAALTDIIAYLEQRDRIEGIENLEPPSAPSEPFLRKLEELEWKNAPTGERRRLDIYAVGGVASVADKPNCSLLERLGFTLFQAYQAFYTGETETDLVVPFSSATAANKANSGYKEIRTNCDHFSYFTDCGAKAISEAIGLLWDSFNLTDSIAPFLVRSEPRRFDISNLPLGENP